MHCVKMNYYAFYTRLLRCLKRKDPIQIKLEQLEQGFSLYLNGANSELRNYRRRISSHGHIKNETKTNRTNGELHESFTEIAIYNYFKHLLIRAVMKLVRSDWWRDNSILTWWNEIPGDSLTRALKLILCKEQFLQHTIDFSVDPSLIPKFNFLTSLFVKHL